MIYFKPREFSCGVFVCSEDFNYQLIVEMCTLHKFGM